MSLAELDELLGQSENGIVRRKIPPLWTPGAQERRISCRRLITAIYLIVIFFPTPVNETVIHVEPASPIHEAQGPGKRPITGKWQIRGKNNDRPLRWSILAILWQAQSVKTIFS